MKKAIRLDYGEYIRCGKVKGKGTVLKIFFQKMVKQVYHGNLKVSWALLSVVQVCGN